MRRDLQELKNYITSTATERANDHLVFPFFTRIFGQNQIVKESEASGADLLIDGRLIVEFKTHRNDWLAGFYQALHYRKKGRSFSHLAVIAHDFLALWRLDEIPIEAFTLAKASDPNKAPSKIGRTNANKTNPGLKNEILNATGFYLYDSTIDFLFEQQLLEFEDQLRNLDVLRKQINPENFLRKIGSIKPLFPTTIEAIHAFYALVPFWDTTARMPEAPPSDQSSLILVAHNGDHRSDTITLDPSKHEAFRDFVNTHYLYTNEEAGVGIDYYFSRFDEALAEHDPDYVDQHGIFFTDINLSRFALWFVREKYGERKLSDNYVVIDPAGGSGNLVASWRKEHLKFKVVSELNPDLLRAIELRLRSDPNQVQQGFSIIPRTHENKGLNFIDKSASEYLETIQSYLNTEGRTIDRPLAFLLNPPYKNTDENEAVRQVTESEYDIHESILEITGRDAGKERYLAFLAQIVRIAEQQHSGNPELTPLLLIFTPTSWLIPRPSYAGFRQFFDKHFKFEKGFMITGKSFFRGTGRWPVAFTIWRYAPRSNKNNVKLYDFTDFDQDTFKPVNWNAPLEELKRTLNGIIRGRPQVLFDTSRGDIRTTLPDMLNYRSNNRERQQMFDFKRSPTNSELESNAIYGGLPSMDPRRTNKKTYGAHDGEFLGVMDNGTPVRIRQDKFQRMSNSPDRVWFRLDNDFKGMNKTRITSGPTDKYSYCAYDLQSAQALFSWYGLTKALNGRNPVWSNQFDIWPINSPNKTKIKEYLSLCFAFGLADNRCIVATFPANDPVQGVPERFLHNPLSPNDQESFWTRIMRPEVSDAAGTILVDSVTDLYTHWNTHYAQGQTIQRVGLSNEPYFAHFDSPDFLTPDSGLSQIRSYAILHNKGDLIERFERIRSNQVIVLERLHDILIEDLRYFE